ncbi:Uncharacterised protein [Mycobacteroides abscessus subsp. abscessus]|nr:Uncharacterised protein [Mycobacteroides abscessus subsp. abscessus]
MGVLPTPTFPFSAAGATGILGVPPGGTIKPWALQPTRTASIAVSSCWRAVATKPLAFCRSASFTPWPPIIIFSASCTDTCSATADFIEAFAAMIAA